MMTAEMCSSLKQLLIKHEGLEKFPYVDTVGKVTIGIGYNLTDRGMSDEWINKQYEEDVRYFYNALTEAYEWFRQLDEPRQMVLIDMCFMGFKKFQTFKRMIAALEDRNYNLAAHEMLNSKWATQVHGRATELAEIMVSGKLS